MLAFFTNYIMDRNILFENIIKLEEAAFKAEDAGKSDGYVESVVDYLLGEGDWAEDAPTEIRCVKKGNSQKSEPDVEYALQISDLLDEEKIEKLRALKAKAIEHPSKELAAEFSSIFSDRKDFSWTKIFKGIFSGFDDKKLKTDEQESIQAVLIAAAIEGDFTGDTKGLNSKRDYEVGYLRRADGSKADIWESGKDSIYDGQYGDAVCNFVGSNLNLRDYKKQMIGMGKILHKALPEEVASFRGSSFSILQPGGITNPKLMTSLGGERNYNIFVSALFVTSPKGRGLSDFKINFGENSLDKDTFAPADLYIVKNDDDSLSIIKGELDEVLYKKDPLTGERLTSSVDDFVRLTNSLFERRLAVPISLKLSSNPSWHKIVNSDPTCLSEYSIGDITSIKFNPNGNSIIEASKKSANKVTGTATFEFRRKGETSPWCCYANIKGNNDAFVGGNCKTYMRLAFQNPDMDTPITEGQLESIKNWPELNGKMTGDPNICLGVGAKSGNAQMGGIGIGNFLWELFKAKDQDSCITYVIQHAFKEAADIQDTMKIM